MKKEASTAARARIEAPAGDYRAEDAFMQAAIEEARDGIYNGDGGPYGAVVVKDGRIIGRGHHCSPVMHDSTCHGEIVAIRDAEKNLGSHELPGAVLYTTGEPCMMCLMASLYAKIEHIYYGCRVADNSLIGFRDKDFAAVQGCREKMRDYLEELDREACLQLFEEYKGLGEPAY